MSALTEKQRRFVLAMASAPWETPTEWCRMAGYSDHKEACKVAAHRLVHECGDKIERAVREVCIREFRTIGPALAMQGLFAIARNKQHRDHFKALDSLADRVGFHRQTTHNVAVQHTDLRGEALLERIKVVAGLLGVPAEKLLGENVVSREPVETKVIEHQLAEPEPSDGVSAEAKAAYQLMCP